MTKSATDLMQEIIFSAVLDSIAAMKSASKGLPNTLLRDLNSIHANTTFADLPKEVQSSIASSVRSAFTRLLKEGYSVSTGQPAPTPHRGVPIRRDGPRHDRGPRPPNHDRKGPGGRPGGGGRPGPKGGAPRPGPKSGAPRRGPSGK